MLAGGSCFPLFPTQKGKQEGKNVSRGGHVFLYFLQKRKQEGRMLVGGSCFPLFSTQKGKQEEKNVSRGVMFSFISYKKENKRGEC